MFTIATIPHKQINSKSMDVKQGHGPGWFQGINGHRLSLTLLSFFIPTLFVWDWYQGREENSGSSVLWCYRLFLWVDSINIPTLIDSVGFEHWKLDSQRKLQAFQASA